MKRFQGKYVGVLLLLWMMVFQTACTVTRDDSGAVPNSENQILEWQEADVHELDVENLEVEVLDAEIYVIPGGEEEDTAGSQHGEWLIELPVEGYAYYDLENVVLYLYLYEELPVNYITKSQARELGWEGGSVERYQEGAAIGGDRFGNREELLPEAEDREYTECDLYTNGQDSRGARRLVFSNDGLYYYTEDHYETFVEVFVTERYEVIW